MTRQGRVRFRAAAWLALLLVGWLPTARAQLESLPSVGEPIGLYEAEQGSLLLRTDRPGAYVPAPTLSSDVRVRVTGMIVRAEITQRFLNPTSLWVEGIYVFPLPETAAVDALRMVVGDRIVEGQIQEREEARRRYEEARIGGFRASLVEQERPNIFTTSVANIGPDEMIEVEITYQQTLRYDSGEFHLRLPLVVAPRYVPGGGIFNGDDGAVADRMAALLDAVRISPPIAAPGDPYHNPVTLMVDLDPGFPVKWTYSPSHAVSVRDNGDATYEVTLEDGLVPANRDFVLTWAPDPGAQPDAALFTEELDDDVYTLLLVLPPQAQDPGFQRLPRETVFVVDTSGSMTGASLEQAKGALLIALDGLQPQDRFNVIQFNSVTSALFPEPRPATPETVDTARDYVDGLAATGGTEMLPALRAALRGEEEGDEIRQVIFITDGAVGNEAELFDCVVENLGDRRLFTVGIGSAPNSHFMHKAAQFGRGSFTYIGSQSELSGAMSGLFRKLESPTLSDIEVEWPDPGAEVWPARVPDLYAGEPIVLVARLGEVDGEVIVTGRRGEESWEMRLPGKQSVPDSGVDKVWARAKIAALMDGLHEGRDPQLTRRDVVDIALRHHLVSRYTSLVAVDLTPSAPVGMQPVTRPIPINLPAGWSPQRFSGSLPQTASAGPLSLVLGLSLLGCAMLVRLLPELPGRQRRGGH